MQESVKRHKKGSHAVNRKHPDGSLAGQGQVAFAESMKGSECNFHAPTGYSAFDKIFKHTNLHSLNCRENKVFTTIF